MWANSSLEGQVFGPEGVRGLLKVLRQARLLQDRVCGMSGFDLVIDWETDSGVRREPDVMVPFAPALKVASCFAQQTSEIRGEAFAH